MAIQTPGALFLGTLVPAEQKFIKQILLNARQQGYNKMIEPCCGAFAMSHLAVQSGYKPSEIQCSDVTMFSSIYGYGIMEKPMDDLEIHAKDFTEEECKDYATMMYAILYYRTRNEAGSDFFYAMLRDLEVNKEKHIQKLDSYIKRARSLLKGINYRPMDLNDHIDEIIDDPHAIIIANPPTYKAGFEKWYDSGGNMTWKEPHYNIFDPKTGLIDLMQEKMANAKALIICYEENEVGKAAGYPIFSRYGVRKGVNVYLTTNRPDEATALAEGRTIVRPKITIPEPLACSIVPDDYEFSEKTKISFMKIEPVQSQYYRGIWTHNYVGSSAMINLGLFADGMIFGVIGIQLTTAGGQINDRCYIHYGITMHHNYLRLNRLLTMIGISKETLRWYCSEYNLSRFKAMSTTQETKYQESKEMRGIMKLTKRDKGPLGYKLTYECPLTEKKIDEILKEFLKREKQWREQRAKTKNQE